MSKPKLLRITTVPISMNIILRDQLKFMNQYVEVIGITGYDSKHFNEIKQREKVELHALTMERNISIVKDFMALWKMFFLIRKLKPAIVHTHTPKAGLLGMLAARMNGVEIRIHTVAGLPLMGVKGVKRKILNRVEKITLKNANYVFPNSYGLKEFLLKYKFCAPSKLKVIGNGSSNGVDTNFFSPNLQAQKPTQLVSLIKDNEIGKEDFVFCFVGRLAQEKGIKELVTAFVKLIELPTYEKAKLLLVGPFEKMNGKLGDDLEKIIAEKDAIIYVGRHDDIRPYLALSNVFVLPTYREGFPNVLLQAGAMGLPCIATDINGCNEIIKNEVNGLLIETKSSEAVYTAMKFMIDNPSIRKKMSLNARPMIIEKYDRNEFMNNLLLAYQTALSKKKR